MASTRMLLLKHMSPFLGKKGDKGLEAAQKRRRDLTLSIFLEYCRDKNYSGSGKYFQELISEKLLTLLQDRPCLDLSIVSSKFQALLFFQDELLESVWKPLINTSVKKLKK